MKRTLQLVILLGGSFIGNSQTTPTISGFSKPEAQQQLQLEQQFDTSLKAAEIGATIKQLSAFPHHLGSKGDRDVANTILAKYKSWGWDAKIETYKVLFPTPKTRQLELLGSKPYKAVLKEKALAEDATSGQEGQLPTYNCWSADGNVTAPLVFVNYGLPDDYEELKKRGIDVKGKIVIAKYGHSWRGIKPKIAQEHGAIGCIIYSDPQGDGYTKGDVYPKGAFKNEYGVQRGSVMDMVIYPGDPLTPNVGATENAPRLDRSQATNLLKIPVLPISYHDAPPFLEALEGPVAPDGWAGNLPLTYHIGPSKADVHLQLAFDWNLVTANDIVATIKGSEFPDEWVVRGNHHDAWVNGANDPISGQSALLEEAKAIGELVKTGWRPKRTIVYCSWDGEEPGLIGSTEWVEDHAAELQQKVVAYINSDDNGRGFLSAGGSHALEQFVNEVASGVNDPQTNVSVLQRKIANEIANAKTSEEKKELLGKSTIKLEALGSGSDFSPFLQHLAVPTLDYGFGGEDEGGEYHSIFDSYDLYVRFKDPTFDYGVALAKTAGHSVLRLADATNLPFNFEGLTKTLNGYLADLIKTTNQLRESTEVGNEVIKKRIYDLSNDPTKHFIVPQPKDEVPYLDFSPLQNALAKLDKTVVSLNKQLALPQKDVDATNKILYQAEQELLSPDGLPKRSWYKHTIYAPGFYTGYGVKTMPGIREAIEQRNWKEAQEQISKVADAINRLSNHLGKLLNQTSK
jgi:N-acetylated-alpha-linked acidic dipeptidase